MKRILVIYCVFLTVFGPLSCLAQVDIEKTAKEICECLEKDKRPLQELLEPCYGKIYDEKTVGITDPEILNSINTQLVKRLSRTCKKVAFHTEGNHPNTSYRAIEKDKESVLSDKQCRSFSDNNSFYYIESWGDTTQVKIDKGEWVESFPDGTYSKSAFKWKKGCRFEIEFIESNHRIKKDMSKKGEVYQYKLIDHNAHKRHFQVIAYSGDFFVEGILKY